MCNLIVSETVWAALICLLVPQVAHCAGKYPALIDRSAKTYLFREDGGLVLDTTVDLTVLTSAGISAGTIPVPVHAGTQRFTLLFGYTEAPSGRRLPLDPSAVKVANVDRVVGGDIVQEIIQFPSVAVGDKLHVEFRIEQPKPDFPGVISLAEIEDFPVPVATSSIVIRAPSDVRLSFDTRGLRAEPRAKSGGMTTYSFSARRLVPRVSTAGDVDAAEDSPRIFATNLKSWGELARDYSSIIPARAEADPNVVKLAQDLSANVKDPAARVARTSEWMRSHIRFVDDGIGVGRYRPQPVADTLQKRQGDCKAEVELFDALLAAEGIPASPLLINTAAIYELPSVPTAAAFNHVVSYIRSSGQIVDLSPGVGDNGLAFQDIGKQGLLIPDGAIIALPRQPLAAGIRGSYDVSWTAGADEVISGVSEPVGGERSAMSLLAAASRALSPPQTLSLVEALNGSTARGSVDIKSEPQPKSFQREQLTVGKLDSGTWAIPLSDSLAPETINNLVKRWSEPHRHRFQCQPFRLDEQFSFSFPPGMTLTRPLRSLSTASGPFRFSIRYTLAGSTLRVERILERRSAGPVCPGDEPAAMARLRDTIRTAVEKPIIIGGG